MTRVRVRGRVMDRARVRHRGVGLGPGLVSAVIVQGLGLG